MPEPITFKQILADLTPAQRVEYERGVACSRSIFTLRRGLKEGLVDLNEIVTGVLLGIPSPILSEPPAERWDAALAVLVEIAGHPGESE